MSENKPMTIVEFLEARIAADERAIMKLAETDRRPVLSVAITVNHPQRLLAECAAKRAILDLYERHRENRDARRSPRARAAEDERAAQDRRTQEARTSVAEDALRALAAVYAAHPDYQQEWSA